MNAYTSPWNFRAYAARLAAGLPGDTLPEPERPGDRTLRAETAGCTCGGCPKYRAICQDPDVQRRASR